MKQQILDRLNEIIVEERGVPVTMNDKFTDADLDSLGTVITLASLDAEYPIFKGIPETEDAFQLIDIPELTVRELVRLCVLSTTNTSRVLPKQTDSSQSQNSIETN